MADEQVDDFTEMVSPSSKPRKRARCPQLWKKNVRKAILYGPDGKQPSVACVHVDRVYRNCYASTLTQSDMDSFFQGLYSSSDKTIQDAFLLKCMDVKTPRRRRGRIEGSTKSRAVTVAYKVIYIAFSLVLKLMAFVIFTPASCQKQ